MTVKNDFSVPYRSIFRETPGRKIRSNQKIVLNRHFVLSHRRVSAKPSLAQTRVRRISSRTSPTERFSPPCPTGGTSRSAEGASLGGPIRPTSVPAQQSPTNLYIKPELARTHIRQSSSRSYPGRTLRKAPSRPSGGAPASPVGPRSAGRSGPCRSRSGRAVGKLWTKTNGFSIHV